MKGPRGANWESREKECVLELVREKVKVIESKECNKNNKIKKEDAWMWVWENYKAKFGDGKRSLKNMKDVWKRMKPTAKAEYMVVNKPKTGGGPPPPPIIKEICPQEFLQNAKRI